MAIVQDKAPASASRHGNYVRDQIRRAMLRVRMLDFATAMLGLLIGVLVYGLAMILLDRWLHFPQVFRQISLAALVIGAVAYLWFTVGKSLRFGVNPYYAALHIELMIPDAKNSLVNWLDLHDESIPPAVRTALEKRAANDLEETDVQEAIPGRHVLWMGAAVVVFGIGMLIALAMMRPGQFTSLLNRAFLPFDNAAVEKQTTIEIITPEGGNATVPVNQSVVVTVHVKGRIPKPDADDAVRLILRRTQEDSTFEERILEPGSDSREFMTRVPPSQVQTGFYYRIAGGDDETPEYRIQVRSSPLMTHFEARLKYRPYLKWQPVTVVDPNFEQMRGTEVTLRAFANRAVSDGKLAFDGDPEHPVIGEPVAEHPNALEFKFVIDKDARYRIWFNTRDGESNSDPLPYTIKALRDNAPQVEFTRPEELKLPGDKSDLRIPANGMLKLEGAARDDFGIRKATLRMRLGKHTRVAPKPYRDEKAFALEVGGFMRTIQYADFVELEKLTDEGGNKLLLRTGDELFYWLEAEDACDYTAPNVGKTREFKVIITEPKTEDQEKDERKKAAQERKNEVEKKNDENKEKENEETKQKQEEQQNKNGESNDKKEPNENKDQNQKQDSKQQPKDDGPKKNEKIDDLVNQLRKDQQPNDKPQPMPPPKEKNESDPKDQNDPMKKPGDPKDQNDPMKKPGDPKDQNDPMKKPGDPKDQNDPMKKPGDPKDQNDPMKKPGDPKDQNDPMKKPGDPKDQNDPMKKPGDPKDQNDPMKKPGDPKPGDPKDQNDPMKKPGNPKDPMKKPGDPKDQNDPMKKPDDPKDQKPGNPKDQKDRMKKPGDPKDQKPGDPKDQKPGDPKDQNDPMKKPGDPKDQKPGDPKDQKDPMKKPGDPKDQKPGDPKDQNDPMKKPGDPKDQKPGDPKDQNDPMKKPGDPKDPGKGQGDPNNKDPKEPGPAGNNPGKGGVDGGPRNGDSQKPDPGKYEDPNKEFLSKLSDLQLEDIRKKVTPDMLKKRGIDPKEWDAYIESIKRARAAAANKPGPKDAKDIESGDRTKGSTANTGVRKVETRPGGPASDIRNSGSSTAPPEYKDSAAKFSELLSKKKDKKNP